MHETTFSTTFSTTFDSADCDAMVSARGELDLETAPAFKAAVFDCIHKRYARIGVDLDAVTFIDCSGINAIIDCRNEATVPGSAIVLLRPRRSVRRVFRLTCTDDLFAA